MIPRDNLWLEHRGLVLLSVWRMKYLEAIDETGSIPLQLPKLTPTEGHGNWMISC